MNKVRNGWFAVVRAPLAGYRAAALLACAVLVLLAAGSVRAADAAPKDRPQVTAVTATSAPKDRPQVTAVTATSAPKDRPQVSAVSATSAAIRWVTATQCRATLTLWQRGRTGSDVYQSIPAASPLVVRDPAETTVHSFAVTGLRPATEYRFTVEPAVAAKAGKHLSGEFAFATRPSSGTTTFWRAPMLVIIYANVIHADTKTADAPLPPPADQARIAYYVKETNNAVRFFWLNSGCALWMPCDFLVIHEWKETGEKAAAAKRPDREADVRKYGKNLADYCGVVEIAAERRWDAGGKKWTYSGSGGGTYGINYPTAGHPGQSFYLGGSDLMWLFVHEVHHQVDSFYGESGYDEYVFNHPAPLIDSAFRFGEHYDCNAWILRHWPRDSWFFCKFGSLATAADGDGDGIPDDMAALPLDEKRFGSDPSKADSDGDGLQDLDEVLSSTWVERLLQAGSDVHAIYHRPDPRHRDSDRDGIPDGADPHPIYEAPEVLRFGTPSIDGTLAPGEWQPFMPVVTANGKAADTYVRWDGRAFYLGADLAEGVSVFQAALDGNDDGWYVGRDNWFLEFVREGESWRLSDLRIVNCTEDRWPFDDRLLVKKEEIAWKAGSRGKSRVLEVALPYSPDAGLGLVPGKSTALAFTVLAEQGTDRWVSAFEPYTLFGASLDSGARIGVQTTRPWSIGAMSVKGGRTFSRNDRVRTFAFTARSEGATTRVVVKATTPKGFIAEPPAQSAVLRPGESRTFTVTLTAGPMLTVGGHDVEVSATAGGSSPIVFRRQFENPMEWYTVAPFDNAGDKGFDARYPPERETGASKSYFGSAGPVSWRLVPPEATMEEGGVDLKKLYDMDWSVAYAMTWLHSPAERSAVLLLGSDDTLTAWLNGKRIIAKKIHRAAAPGQEKVPVTLAKGWNRLLLKICQGGGGWGFYCSVAGEDGRPLQDICSRAR